MKEFEFFYEKDYLLYDIIKNISIKKFFGKYAID